MKKLEKKFGKKRNTIEAYSCLCQCYAVCHFCAGYWQSQHDNDLKKNQVYTAVKVRNE